MVVFKFWIKYCFFTVFVFVTSNLLFAQANPQSQNIFINDDAQQIIDLWHVSKPTTEFHSSFKPYLSSTLNSFADSSISYAHFPIKNKFLSKTFNEGPSKRNQFNFNSNNIYNKQTTKQIYDI